jgi:hypothetical protein
MSNHNYTIVTFEIRWDEGGLLLTFETKSGLVLNLRLSLKLASSLVTRTARYLPPPRVNRRFDAKSRIKRLVLHDPGLSIDDIVVLLDREGVRVSHTLISAVRSEFRDSLRLLASEGVRLIKTRTPRAPTIPAPLDPPVSKVTKVTKHKPFRIRWFNG